MVMQLDNLDYYIKLNDKYWDGKTFVDKLINARKYKSRGLAQRGIAVINKGRKRKIRVEIHTENRKLVTMTFDQWLNR